MTSNDAPIVFVSAAALAVALALLWIASRRAITVCVLTIARGRVTVGRGAVAPRILSDIGDVVARPPVRRATLLVVRRSGRAHLVVRGRISPEQRQRLLNVVGSLPLAMLSNGRRR